MITALSSNSKQLRTLRNGTFGIGFFLALWLAKQPVCELLVLLKDREALIAYLQRYGAWGPVVLTLIIVLHVLIATIPGHVFMIAGGYL